MEVRADGLRTSRVRGLRAFSGGRSARQGRVGAPSLHEARIVSSVPAVAPPIPVQTTARRASRLQSEIRRDLVGTHCFGYPPGLGVRQPLTIRESVLRHAARSTNTIHRNARVSQSCSCMATPPGPSRSDSRSGSFGRKFAAWRLSVSASASRRSTPGVKNITPRVTRTGSPH